MGESRGFCFGVYLVLTFALELGSKTRLALMSKLILDAVKTCCVASSTARTEGRRRTCIKECVLFSLLSLNASLMLTSDI